MNKYNLPEIAFAQKDVAIIENEIISKYEELSNRKLAIADPVHLFLKAIILYVVQQRQIIDYTGKQNLLSYAVGINLDYIGLLLGVKRNPSLSATTTIRFTLSAPQISVITIPKGTRITKDSVIFFATNETIEIKAGEKFIDIVATCQSSGIIGNNIKVNELNILVDPVAFIATVSNITDTTGGVDEEDDESFRLRIQEAPDKFSNAGSIGAYQYWTRTYSQKVIDVSVFSPSAGIVNVLPLMINGELPTTEEL
nr:baseplate J/gp47 family protein [Burkholderiales bacterium]